MFSFAKNNVQMKRLLHSVIIIALSLNAGKVYSQNTLIHYWDFNDTTGLTAGIHMPNIAYFHATYSLLDTSKAQFSYQPLTGTSGDATSYVDCLVPGDTTNCRNGSPIGACIRLRNPYDSMQGVFYIPSTGYHNIIVSFATERSGSGPTLQTYSYSLDSGLTWQNTGMYYDSTIVTATSSPFQLVTVGFSPVADNNAKLVFRILQSGATAGNNRYDNFAVESSPTVNTSVASVNSSISRCVLYPNPVNNNVNFILPYNGDKKINIINAAGQIVFSTVTSANEAAISTSALAAGTYFANIQIGNKTISLTFNKN